MKKTIIAVPGLSPAANSLIQAFVAEAPISDRMIIVACPGIVESPHTKDEQEPGENPSLDLPCIRTDWNPLSYASTRSVWQQAENLAESCPDELILLVAPPKDMRPLADCSQRELELCALSNGSALAALIQEACRRFAENGGGSIVIALCPTIDAGPLPAMAIGAASGLAEGILASPGQDIRFMAVRDESNQPDLLVRYLIKILDESPRDISKILRHTGRGGLFGRA